MWRRNLAERMPRVKRFLDAHPRVSKAFAAYLVIRWVAVPSALLVYLAIREGWFA